ncbi:MAG: endolytic transglycosylase MltG [Lachnospiraceae bacterium]|nr:endolytic transglycosylase MltG [Lachnospiraceae bacterium]
MKKLPIIILVFLLIIGGGAVFGISYYKNGIAPVSKESKEVIITVENGQSAYSILNLLDSHGLVGDVTCGKIYLKLNEIHNLHANTYLLNENMSLSEIFAVMENPTDKYVLKLKVTILEGTSIAEIAESIGTAMEVESSTVLNLLNDTTFIQSLIDKYWFLHDDILAEGIKYPLEGYLYPETYLLNSNNTMEDVIYASLDAMDQYLTANKTAIEGLGWTPHEFLTFASVVERESLFDEDRPKIAGVFKNRLDINMRLQSDITVNYAWERTGVDVSYAHLEIDSPYNTYKYGGLPIGPISTVSSITMDSCINYEDNDYLFFFAKQDGTVIYSKTLAEHNKAVSENKWY